MKNIGDALMSAAFLAAAVALFHIEHEIAAWFCVIGALVKVQIKP